MWFGWDAWGRDSQSSFLQLQILGWDFLLFVLNYTPFCCSSPITVWLLEIYVALSIGKATKIITFVALIVLLHKLCLLLASFHWAFQILIVLYLSRIFLTPIESIPFHEIICLKNIDALRSVSIWSLVISLLRMYFF